MIIRTTKQGIRIERERKFYRKPALFTYGRVEDMTRSGIDDTAGEDLAATYVSFDPR